MPKAKSQKGKRKEKKKIHYRVIQTAYNRGRTDTSYGPMYCGVRWHLPGAQCSFICLLFWGLLEIVLCFANM